MCLISVERDTSVHGYIIDGVFDGVIKTPHEEYHIEVVEKFFDKLVDFHSVIYAMSDVNLSAINGSRPSCGGTGKVHEKLMQLQSSAALITEQDDKLRTKRTLPLTNRFCPILIAADELFYQNIGGGNDATTMNEMTTLMTSVNAIFSGTDFDFDGRSDGIGFIIKRLAILRSTMPGYRYGTPNIGIETFLGLWSQENHDGFCLAMLLTYRDFSDGMLGLAYIAAPTDGVVGGICGTRIMLNEELKSFNTAIVTFLNYGRRISRPVMIMSMAHQFGHSFGSVVSYIFNYS